MSPSTTKDKYAVFGNPISHSKSPMIHSLFAEQTGENIAYEKLEVKVDDFHAEVRAFFDRGGKGLNITVPFKVAAYELASRLTERAKQAMSVNTLYLSESGELIGDNTDGYGLIWDLKERNRQTLTRANVLVLGAGGAARGVLLPLLFEKPRLVVVANRTLSKSRNLEKQFEPLGPVEAVSLEAASTKGPYDIVINATSASVGGNIPSVSAQIFSQRTFAYDMFYADGLTSFLDFAVNNGVSSFSDGLGMLVAQAAESFYIWRGCRPDILRVFEKLTP